MEPDGFIASVEKQNRFMMSAKMSHNLTNYLLNIYNIYFIW